MIETLNEKLIDLLGPLGPLIAVGGAGIILLLIALPMLMMQKADPMERLKQNESLHAANKETRAILRDTRRNEKLNKYAQFLEPTDEQELSQIRLTLLRAGYPSRDAVQYYYFIQLVLALLGLALGVGYMLFFTDVENATMQSKILYVLLPGAAGYLAPKYWVNKRVNARRDEIESGFPDSLDMMLVCVEAGQSMDQSIIRVAKELRNSYPQLAEEYQIVSYEMKAGKDRSTVLRDMGERCGVQDVQSFVTVLNQAASFGTSISDALRVYAEEMRDKRVMRAEEKANKLPTKMTLTTMMFTVPPLLIILVGPSVVNIMNISQ